MSSFVDVVFIITHKHANTGTYNDNQSQDNHVTYMTCGHDNITCVKQNKITTTKQVSYSIIQSFHFINGVN